MSSHPYGLRGDPFASPATLSAKDASRLIRRRVRAFNGDGGTLFPIDTCDLIHEFAGGVPDAMLDLAGRAMRVAADEGAPAVMPAHVRQVAASAPSSAEAATDAAPIRDDADGGEHDPAFDPEDEAANDDIVRTRSEIPTRAQIAARAQAALAEEDFPAIADDDPDLPAFHPAPFALPSKPSENLDPDSRDWVSRFIVPAPGVAQRNIETPHAARPAGEPNRGAGARKRRATPAPSHASAPSSAFAPSPVPTAEAEIEGALAVAYGHAAPKRRALPRPRRRRRSNGQGLLIAVAAVCVVAFIVRMSVRGNLLAPGSEPERPARTSSPALQPESRAAEPAPAVRRTTAPEPAPEIAVMPSTTIVEEPLIGPSSAGQKLLMSRQPESPGFAPATPAPVRHEPSLGKFGLEVATFIFEERARVERDRLAAAGLRARLITTVEYGSRVYRVVVGGFPNPAAAERAADSLLSNGAVLQARVIRNP